MGIEFVNKRKSDTDEAVANPVVVQRLAEAVATGSVEEVNRVSAECGGGPEHKVVEFKKTVRGEVQGWKSVGYVVAFLPLGQAQVLMVRAAGLRTDEQLFTADYAMPPVWEDGTDFTAAARKRLDTFKSCSCDKRGQCKFHAEVMPGAVGPGRWLEEDMKRLQKVQGGQLPEAVEVLMKAEASRAQNRIVVPGRG
jgi:hypothetical protein